MMLLAITGVLSMELTVNPPFSVLALPTIVLFTSNTSVLDRTTPPPIIPLPGTLPRMELHATVPVALCRLIPMLFSATRLFIMVGVAK